MLPAGIASGEVYELPGWGVYELAALRDEARIAADVERRALAAPPVEIHEQQQHWHLRSLLLHLMVWLGMRLEH